MSRSSKRQKQIAKGVRMSSASPNEPALPTSVSNVRKTLCNYQFVHGCNENLVMQKHNFLDAEGDKRQFVDSDFSFCIFERSYFRRSHFKNCKFIGTRFEKCNFRGCTFDGCEFDYAYMEGCLINPFSTRLISNLPSQFGAKRLFLRTIRMNARSIGDAVCENKLVPLELEARRKDKLHAWWPFSGNLGTKEVQYYKAEYEAIGKKSQAFLESSMLWIEKVIWGYGESSVRLVFSVLVLVLCLAICNNFSKGDAFWELKFGDLRESSILILKAVLDLALLNSKELEKLGGLIALAAVTLRVIGLGLFISVVYRRWTYR